METNIAPMVCQLDPIVEMPIENTGQKGKPKAQRLLCQFNGVLFVHFFAFVVEKRYRAIMEIERIVGVAIAGLLQALIYGGVTWVLWKLTRNKPMMWAHVHHVDIQASGLSVSSLLEAPARDH